MNFWQGSNQRGIYRSTDGAESWVRIDDPVNFYMHIPHGTAASRMKFGRIFINNEGFGLIVGDLKESK
jgi:hypothetical protein